jgi:hypothetical protein
MNPNGGGVLRRRVMRIYSSGRHPHHQPPATYAPPQRAFRCGLGQGLSWIWGKRGKNSWRYDYKIPTTARVRFILGMVPPPDLDRLSHAEPKSLVISQFEMMAELQRTVAALRDEIARLKGGDPPQAARKAVALPGLRCSAETGFKEPTSYWKISALPAACCNRLADGCGKCRICRGSRRWAQSQEAIILDSDGSHRGPAGFDYCPQRSAREIWLLLVRTLVRRASDRVAGPQQRTALCGTGNGSRLAAPSLDCFSARLTDCAIAARS